MLTSPTDLSPSPLGFTPPHRISNHSKSDVIRSQNFLLLQQKAQLREKVESLRRKLNLEPFPKYLSRKKELESQAKLLRSENDSLKQKIKSLLSDNSPPFPSENGFAKRVRSSEELESQTQQLSLTIEELESIVRKTRSLHQHCPCQSPLFDSFFEKEKRINGFATVISPHATFKGHFIGRGSLFEKNHILTAEFQLGRRISQKLKMQYPNAQTVLAEAPLGAANVEAEMVPFKFKLGRTVVKIAKCFSFKYGRFRGVATAFFADKKSIKGRIFNNKFVLDENFPLTLEIKKEVFPVEKATYDCFWYNGGKVLKADFEKGLLEECPNEA